MNIDDHLATTNCLAKRVEWMQLAIFLFLRAMLVSADCGLLDKIGMAGKGDFQYSIHSKYLQKQVRI